MKLLPGREQRNSITASYQQVVGAVVLAKDLCSQFMERCRRFKALSLVNQGHNLYSYDSTSFNEASSNPRYIRRYR